MNQNENYEPAAPRRIRILEVGHKQIIDQMSDMVVSVRELHDCLSKGNSRISAIEAELKINSQTTSEVRDILSAARGAFKFFGYLGVVVKWAGGLLAGVAGLVALAYTVIHGRPPAP